MIKLLGALQMDQDSMTGFIRIIFAFFRMHGCPHFFAYVAVFFMNFGCAIKPGNAAGWEEAIATSGTPFLRRCALVAFILYQ